MKADLRREMFRNVFWGVFIFWFCLLVQPIHAERPADSDSSLSLDLMITPQSPGFTILGIEPTSVERPGTMTDLAMTILNRTENFGRIPDDFALEFAPYWLFAGSRIGYQDYAADSNYGANFLQTLSFSIASSTSEIADSSTTSLGIGLRFSLKRGEIDENFEDYKNKLDSLYMALANINQGFAPVWQETISNDTFLNSMSEQFKANSDSIEALKQRKDHADEPISRLLEEKIKMHEEQNKTIERLIGLRESEIKHEVEAKIREQKAEELQNTKDIISKLKVRRTGFKIDVAAALAIDFPGQVFDDGDLSRWGAWLTSGHEGTKWSFLGVVRYFDSINGLSESSLDLGGRVIFDNIKRFSLSGEGLYRRLPDRDENKNEWRVALNFDYAIAKNKSVSLTFGRDFEGTKTGNVISLVNLILGFGSNRPIR